MNKITSAKEISDFIKDLENRFNPQDWKIDDVDIWPVLRVNLHYELSAKLIKMSGRERSFKQKVTRALGAFSSIFEKKAKPAKILMVSDGISYTKIDSYLYERFCDPIISILEVKSVTWLKWNLSGNLNGSWKYKAFNIEGALDLRFIFSKMDQVKLVNQIPNFKEFIIFIMKETGICWSEDKINKQINQFISIEKWYLKQLKLIKPSLVIIVSYYSDRGMALIKACRSLNIQTADIQHGVQGEMHMAYSNWQKVPITGYNTLPNDFIVWSEAESEAIKKWAKNTPHSSMILGNLFEEGWFAKEGEIITGIDSTLKSLLETMSASKTVLFTLQYGLEYEEWVFECIRVTQFEFNWLIRLHPVINDEFHINKLTALMKKYGITNYELIISSSLPLYGVLRNVNVHVTHSSTTVVEAKHFGVKSIILSDYGQEFFSQEINERTAYCIHNFTAEDLRNLCNSTYSERVLNAIDMEENKAEVYTNEYLETYL